MSYIVFLRGCTVRAHGAWGSYDTEAGQHGCSSKARRPLIIESRSWGDNMEYQAVTKHSSAEGEQGEDGSGDEC